MPADRACYAAAFPHGPIDLDRALAVHHLRATPIATGDPDAQVWRLEPSVVDRSSISRPAR